MKYIIYFSDLFHLYKFHHICAEDLKEFFTVLPQIKVSSIIWNYFTNKSALTCN